MIRYPALMILLCLAGALSALGDEVVMKNGDRITGKVLSQTGEKISIETEYAGVVSIVADKVSTIKIIDNQTPAKSAPTEPAPAPSTAAAVTAPPEPAAVPKRAPFTAIYKKLTTGWDGAANVGFSYTSGNSRTSTFTAGIRAEHATTSDKWTMYLKGLVNRNRLTGTSITTSNAIWGGVRYDRNFSKNMFVFGTYDLERDKPQRLNLRSVLGAGIGDHLIRNDRTELDVLGGAAWNRTWRVGPQDSTIAELIFGNQLKHKFFDRLKLQQGFTLYPSLLRAGEYRFVLDATLAADVTKRIGVFATVADRFNSAPLTNIRRNDFLFTTGLKWSFGSKKK